MRLVVTIPALNEEETIGEVVRSGFLELIEDRINVVFEITKVLCLWANEVRADGLMRLVFQNATGFYWIFSDRHV